MRKAELCNADDAIFRDYAFREVVPTDALPLTAAVVVAWLSCWFVLESFFLAAFTVAHIVLSFAIGHFVFTRLCLPVAWRLKTFHDHKVRRALV